MYLLLHFFAPVFALVSVSSSTFLLSAPLSLPPISGCISCGGGGNLGEGLWASGEVMSGGFSVAGGVSDGRILSWKVN